MWAVCGFVCRGCVCWVPGEMFAKLPIKVSTYKNTESGAPAGKHGVVCRLTLGSVQSGGATDSDEPPSRNETLVEGDVLVNPRSRVGTASQALSPSRSVRNGLLQEACGRRLACGRMWTSTSCKTDNTIVHLRQTRTPPAARTSAEQPYI